MWLLLTTRVSCGAEVPGTRTLPQLGITSVAYFLLSYNCIKSKKILTAEYLVLQMHSIHVSALFNVWYSFKRYTFPYEGCGQIFLTDVSLEYSRYLGAEPCLQYFQQAAVLLCYFMW